MPWWLLTLVAVGAAMAERSGGSLKGAGSSFVFPLVSQWQVNYKAAQITYGSVGRGAGIAAITGRTVDFGASDAPLTKDQASACKGCEQIPWALSPTSIPYNIPGVGYGAASSRSSTRRRPRSWPIRSAPSPT